MEPNLTESACRDVIGGHLKNISADILARPAADQGLMKLSDMYSSQETNYCRTHYSFIFIVSVSETASSFTPWHRFCRPVYPDWDWVQHVFDTVAVFWISDPIWMFSTVRMPDKQYLNINFGCGLKIIPINLPSALWGEVEIESRLH